MFTPACRILTAITFSVLAGVCLMTVPASAGPPTKDYFIAEIRFSLTLNETDPVKGSPQFYTAIPLGNNKFFVTTFNYFDQPNYLAGGVQVQVWDNGVVVAVEEIPGDELYINGDVIRWSQKVTVNAGTCTMDFTGLSSQTWGNSLNANTVSVSGTGKSNFNNFDPDTIVAESGVLHGHNRVVDFKITDVTYLETDSDKKPLEDTTTRTIYATPL